MALRVAEGLQTTPRHKLPNLPHAPVMFCLHTVMDMRTDAEPRARSSSTARSGKKKTLAN